MFLQIRKQKEYLPRQVTPPGSYKQLHRFAEDHVSYLTARFLEIGSETRGGALSPTQKMEVALRYLSNPGFQSGVAKETGVHQSTISNTVWDVLQSIMRQSHEWICFPQDGAETNRAKLQFAAAAGFPSGIGAIDCTHVRIEKPAGAVGDEYVNRKGFASINVQATCSEMCVFTSVDVSWPGSVHDSRVFKNSAIYAPLLANGVNSGVLLGDRGYGITPFLMAPYPEPNTKQQQRYNLLHARSRVVIERTFGQLKRRFPILRYGIRLQLHKAPTCIITCMVLHNVAKFLNEEDSRRIEDPGYVDDGEDQPVDDEVNGDGPQQLRLRGQQRRNEIVALV